jgi:hypothetical protein
MMIGRTRLGRPGDDHADGAGPDVVDLDAAGTHERLADRVDLEVLVLRRQAGE